MLNVTIIGGGFSGLGVAHHLLKANPNCKVSIFEASDKLGGLASGFRRPNWDWSIEPLIHHWFSTDNFAFEVVKDVGLGDKIILKETKSSCFYKEGIVQLDSAASLARFPYLEIQERIRMGAILALLKIDRNYLRYEKESAYDFLTKSMGKKAFEKVWKPLFVGKFGKLAPEINASWFWGRINPRTKKLAYVQGGFQTLIDCIEVSLKKRGARIFKNSPVECITKNAGLFEVISGGKKNEADIVVLATPLEVSSKLFREFPKEYKPYLRSMKSIGIQYGLLELNRKFLTDGTYWLNINEEGFPFMMVAEHTNFISSKYYGGNHLVWVGKYVDYEDPIWKISSDKYFELIIPYLKKINPSFDKRWVKNFFPTKLKNAQPIIYKNYSKMKPHIESPVKNLFLASMNHIYPWDRNTNNALMIGKEVAERINFRYR